MVYAAFSSAVVGGLWQQMPLAAMATLLGVCAVLLAISMAWCLWISRRLGFNQADEATILFCGAQKSLVSGIPMANVLFSAAVVGPMILPVMLFHPCKSWSQAFWRGAMAAGSPTPLKKINKGFTW